MMGDWSEAGACYGIDPSVMVPDSKRGREYAKTFCARCPVTAQCLAHAMATGEQHGIWGGKDPDERRALRRNGTRR